MSILIVMWFVMYPQCGDARGCMAKSTAVTMQEFSTKDKCEQAKSRLQGLQGTSAICVDK